MFNNLNVRKKLLVGFGIILILTILIASFSRIELKKSNDSLKDLMAGAVKADDLIKENKESKPKSAKSRSKKQEK